MNSAAKPPHDPGRSYDEIPYVAGAILGTCPDDLAMVGILWSLEPPSVERCRVLELGCATGDNLIAMAAAQPLAEFIGIDASPRQVEIGHAQIAALGLRNIKLLCQRIEDELPALEKFDYVLCHGVYSWVPPGVQQRLLALCREVLAPNGLAYVSYNTQPGWHLRQQLRDMLLFHVHDHPDSLTRLSHARSLLDFLAVALRERSDPYGRMLLAEAETLLGESDAYLFHEYLEENNAPLFFFEFIARAAAQGLHYVDEMLARRVEVDVPATAREALEAGQPDRITAEQYLDFLTGRAFRRSILCHREVRPRNAEPLQALSMLRSAAASHTVSKRPNLYSDAPEAFQNAGGVRLETNHPVVKTALFILGENYPRSLPFAELLGRVEQLLREAGASPPAEARQVLAESLYRCHQRGFLELRVSEPPFVLDVSERPTASPLARAQAVAREPMVASLRHHLVSVGAFEQRLLGLLDGSTTRSQLVERMADLAASDAVSLSERVDRTLHAFARSALLIA